MNRPALVAILVSPAFAAPGAAQTAAQTDAPRTVVATVHADRSDGALPPVWRFFGADEPNYATMKDGETLLAKLGTLRKDDMYFRAHNLLNTGDGTASFKWGSTNVYTETKDGKPVYNWTNVDRIIDTYRARGVRPIRDYVDPVGSAPFGRALRPAGLHIIKVLERRWEWRRLGQAV